MSNISARQAAVVPIGTRDKTRWLAKAIRDDIVKKVYWPETAIPSERELMLKHEVSRTTVRRAIQLLVDEGVVVRRAGSGTYVRKAEGGPLASSPSSGTVLCLIIPTYSNPLYADVIDGIERAARGSGYDLITSQSDYVVASENARLSAMADDASIRGAIVVPSMVERPTTAALQFVSSGKPLVYLGRWPNDIEADGVRIDHYEAARIAVRHLVELGHSRIAYVEGAPRLEGFSMLPAYRDALVSAGIARDRSLARMQDEPSELAGQRAVEALVADRTAFSAVFVRNDVTAIGIMRGLRNAGLNVPGDVSVVSVNDSIIARSMDPLLTSVNVQPQTLGSLTFRVLSDRISGVYNGPPIYLTLKPTLSVYGSTSAPSTSRG
ncbi:MAG: GntR family transcriptional regulator [Boseongicola sp. SB0662_bin_57]|nr:GntR family transcriptional regulator [Boseongicola sp. SB0662_bin_57]